MAYTVASSARDLMVGSGNMTTTSGSKTVTFSAAQSFKPGACVIVDYTQATFVLGIIEKGDGTTWYLKRAASASLSAKAFKTNETGTTRSRGSSGAIIPGAKHYLYRSVLDGAGTPAPDWYTYFDTLEPDKGVHPYTLDAWTGASMVAPEVDNLQQGIPDMATRLRVLEGALRVVPGAADGDLSNVDAALDAIVARLYQLEAWAIRVGTNSPPAQGSQATASYNDLLTAGDPA